MALQWLTLVATIWLQTINGSNSNFPAYSSEIKKILNISQLQLNTLTSASDAGKLLGWISGIAAQHLPLWLVLLIGSLLGLIGYGVQFLFVSNKIPTLSYWEVFALTVLAGHSICWINTVCYVLVIKNFPLDRQVAVGLTTSYVGLSAKVYTDTVDAFVSPNDVSEATSRKRAELFLLLNSIVPLVVCVVTSFLARDVEVEKTMKLAGGFFSLFVITVLTGVFAVITSMGTNIWPDAIILSGMVLLLTLPLVVPFGEKMRERWERRCMIRVSDEGLSSSSTAANEISVKDDDDDRESCRRDRVSDDDDDDECAEIDPKTMLRRVDFWLYFFVYFLGATIGMVYFSNLGQIAESRGCSRVSSFVSLSSACSFFGRLLPSIVDYFFAKFRYISRGASMGCMMIPMSLSFFLLIIPQDASLYISTATIGICTGAINSITVSTTSELFGPKNFGVNHNIVISNIPLGSFLFGGLAALLYKNNARAGDGNKNYVVDDECIGQKCYRTTFIIWGFLSMFGAFLAFAFHARTRKRFRNKVLEMPAGSSPNRPDDA